MAASEHAAVSMGKMDVDIHLVLFPCRMKRYIMENNIYYYYYY